MEARAKAVMLRNDWRVFDFEAPGVSRHPLARHLIRMYDVESFDAKDGVTTFF